MSKPRKGSIPATGKRSSIVYQKDVGTTENFLLHLTVRANPRGREGKKFYVDFSMETYGGGAIEFRRHYASVELFFSFLTDSIPFIAAQTGINHEDDWIMYSLIKELIQDFQEKKATTPTLRIVSKPHVPAKVLAFPVRP